MYFGFVGTTFLPMTDVSMQKWNNSLSLKVTSGLSIHYFETTVGFFTQNYNQDLLSPVFRRACLIDLVIGANFQGFRGFLLFENLIFFFNFLEAFFLNLIETSLIGRVIFLLMSGTPNYSEFAGSFTNSTDNWGGYIFLKEEGAKRRSIAASNKDLRTNHDV